MKEAINWIVSGTASCLMFVGLDLTLPADMDRLYVLSIGGLAAIVWRALISKPLDRWAAKP